MNKKYNPILILTALPFESRTILNHHKINIKPKKLTTFQLENSIYLMEVPIGFKFDISTLNQEVEKIFPKLLINFCICGALDSTIPIGASFQIEEACHLNKEFTKIQLPKIESAFQSASLLTVDGPVLKMKQRDELYSQTGCRLVEMEAFHLARFCRKHNIPLLVIKVSSDQADENSLDVIKTNRTILKQSLKNAYEKLISELC